MPNLRQSLVELDPKRYERHGTVGQSGPEPFRPMPAPEPPTGIARSAVMISSLPAVSTYVDGILRQFYGGPRVPTRRILGPS
jgi:hypothetical protein